MKLTENRLLRAIGEADEKMVEKTAPDEPFESPAAGEFVRAETENGRRPHRIVGGLLTAAAAAACIAAVIFLPRIGKEEPSVAESTAVTSTTVTTNETTDTTNTTEDPNGLHDGVLSYERYEDGLTVARCNKEIEELVIPSEYMGIPVIRIGNTYGDAVFEGLGLKRISLPDSVTSIGDSAFSGCTGLKSITIPGSVTSIGEWAFRQCYDLKSITIPDSVTSIGFHAFDSCINLTDITIPASVTSIGKDVFEGCSDFTVHGKAGSFAESYAKENKLHFQAE